MTNDVDQRSPQLRRAEDTILVLTADIKGMKYRMDALEEILMQKNNDIEGHEKVCAGIRPAGFIVEVPIDSPGHGNYTTVNEIIREISNHRMTRNYLVHLTIEWKENVVMNEKKLCDLQDGADRLLKRLLSEIGP